MTTETEQKDKKEPFAYSWYLPVSGGLAPDEAIPPEPLLEPEPEPENEGMVETAQAVEEPAPKRMAARTRPRGASRAQLNLSPSLLRIAGLSVWSIISGVGLIALVVTQSPFPMTQVLALGGVSAVVSALIWFIPSKLTK